MKFNQRISVKQLHGIFFLVIGFGFLYSVYNLSENHKVLLFIISILFFGHGITIFFEDSKKRYKILRAPNTGEYDSGEERSVGDYFKRKNIKFYVHPEVKIPSKVWIFENPFKKIILRPDFFLPEYKIYVEYWGLIGDKNYDEKRKLKRKAYLENDIDFIDIYPDNLENIDWIFTQKLLDLIRSKEGNNTYKS